VVILGFLAPYLPLTFQRILSILPFANVSWEAKLAASSTISWRLEVWKPLRWTRCRDYLMVGKGFAFSAQDVMTLTARRLYMNDIDYVLASRNYHNGMLHTLLDLGPARFDLQPGLHLYRRPPPLGPGSADRGPAR
jgi:hypothetical protein